MREALEWGATTEDMMRECGIEEWELLDDEQKQTVDLERFVKEWLDEVVEWAESVEV